MTKESEELLFEGMDFGGMFQVESEEPTDDTDPKGPEDTEETKDEVKDEDPTFTADLGEDESDEDSDPDKTETDSGDPSDESNNSSSSSSYQVFAKALYDEGVITSLDEDSEIESAESLIEPIKLEIAKQVSDYKESLPDVVQEIIERYEDGVDLGEFIATRKEEDDFSNINEDDLEDNESLTKSIIKRDLIESGYTAEDADEEIDDIYELGKQVAKGKRSFKRVDKRISEKKSAMVEQAKAQRKANEDQYKKQLSNITKNIEDTKEIAGVELTGKQRKDALRAMVDIVDKVGDTPVNAITKSRMENPIEFDKNVSLLWTITKGFTDFSGLQKTVKRKAMKDLEDNFNNPQKAATATNKRKRETPSGSFYPQETVFSNIKF